MAYLLFPKNITLSHNLSLDISKEKVKDEEAFVLLIPQNMVTKIVDHLKFNHKFSNAVPSFNRGEDYGISRMLIPPWELHIRIYNESYFSGFAKVNAHIEIARRYLQHLNFKYVQPVIYEPFKYYKELFSEFLLVYESKYMVDNGNENYWFKVISPESNLIPWHPSSLFSYTINGIAKKVKNMMNNDDTGKMLENVAYSAKK